MAKDMLQAIHSYLDSSVSVFLVVSTTMLCVCVCVCMCVCVCASVHVYAVSYCVGEHSMSHTSLCEQEGLV